MVSFVYINGGRVAYPVERVIEVKDHPSEKNACRIRVELEQGGVDILDVKGEFNDVVGQVTVVLNRRRRRT